MTIDPLPQTLPGICADAINLGAVLTAFKVMPEHEHVGMLIALGAIVVGTISWHFMGG